MPRAAATGRVVLRPGHPPDVTILIDGQELKQTTRAVTIRGEVGTFPTIELEMLIETVDADVEGRVELAEATQVLLAGLGWTPPPDDDGGR
jgi:hypothetical protein